MKIYIQVNLNTDGDFYLKENYTHEFYTNRNYEDYFIYKVFDSNKEVVPETWDAKSWLKFEAKSFLAEILINLRFNTNKYYLMSTLCDFFDDAIHSINSIESNNYYNNNLWGNYEGSSITIEYKE